MCASFARPLETRQAAVGVLERSGEGRMLSFFFWFPEGEDFRIRLEDCCPTLLTTCFWFLFSFVSVLIKFGSSLSTSFSLTMGWHCVTRADLELTL